MSTMSPVPFESLTALSRAVDEQLADRGMQLRSAAFSLCVEAVEFAREGTAPMVATRARSAAQLLLELSCPELDPDARGNLAAACARVAGP